MQANLKAALSNLDNDKLQEAYAKLQKIGQDGTEERQKFLDKIHSAFTNADANADGTIDPSEGKTLLPPLLALAGVEPTEENIQTLFSQIDVNADQRITEDELIKYGDKVTQQVLLPAFDEAIHERGLVHSH